MRVLRLWSDECFLGAYSDTTNDYGDPVKAIVYSPESIFCNEKSVKYSEFYQAQAVGMKPEIVLEVKIVDYNKENYVKYEDEEYTVLRTYKTSSENIELTLKRGVNNGTT